MTDTGGPEPPRARRAPGRILRASRLLVALSAFLVFVVSATGWVGTRWLDTQLRSVLALDPDSDAISDAEGQRGDENILLVGSDSRAEVEHDDRAGDATAVLGARSDTIMVAHLPANRSRLLVVSFPRDLEIQRPSCALWDPMSGTYSDEMDPGATNAKLNSAYEIGGPLCLTRVIQHLSGLAITRFVGIDFQGFKALVDAVGGVDICVQQPLVDDVLGTIIPTAGHHTISGDTALSFVRARFVTGDPTSDYGRITRQQRFLSSLGREVLSAHVLLNSGRLHAVIDAVSANTVGQNISASALFALSQSMYGLSPADLTFVTVPTTGEANEYGNEELRVQDNAALFQAIIGGSPLPGQSAPAAAHATAAQPAAADQSPYADIAVRVLNGARIAGAAAAAAQALQAVGVGVLEVGDSPVRVDATAIHYPPNRKAEALRLLTVIPGAVLEADQRLTNALVVVIGPDTGRTRAGTATTVGSGSGGLSTAGPVATVNAADPACR